MTKNAPLPLVPTGGRCDKPSMLDRKAKCNGALKRTLTRDNNYVLECDICGTRYAYRATNVRQPVDVGDEPLPAATPEAKRAIDQVLASTLQQPKIDARSPFVPDGTTSGRAGGRCNIDGCPGAGVEPTPCRYCARRAEWERAERAKISKPCEVCGGPIEGRSSQCAPCRAAKARISVKKTNAKKHQVVT